MFAPIKHRGTMIAATSLSVLVLSAADGPSPDGWERLRSMPLERRLALQEDLRRFDELPPEERRGIRELDARLAGLPADRRAHTLAVLRRYHRWLEGLSEDQRRQVQAAGDTAERLAVVARLRAQPDEPGGRVPILGMDPADPLGGSVHALADRVRVWLALSPAEQARVAAIPQRPRRIDRLDQLRVELGLPSVRPSGADVEGWTERFQELGPGRDIPLRRFAAKEAGRARERIRERLGEALIVARMPPPSVPTARLARFDAALPGWLREPLDVLPPDAARRRLAILYRLVYPEGQEMPEPKPAPKAGPGSPAASPSSSSSASPPQTPF